ncbi:MAG: DUF3108 domain-containing protein [Acidobacteria bacterium]|nr:DUF3108 domain-containing protein [Acidobacteriota bacterium]
MRRWLALSWLGWSLWAAGVPAAGENLQYVINWPSGLNLGEGRIKASHDGSGNWNFEFQLEAAVPGFGVADHFLSLTTENQCSIAFEKELQHGKRKTREKITFDGGTATRETIGGGKSTLTVPACARDALAYVFHLRKELSLGRLPPAQSVYYGSPYQVRIEYTGTQRVRIGDAYEEADRLVASIKGPASNFSVEAFFGKDQARTPLMVRIPLAMGTFSMEIVR